MAYHHGISYKQNDTEVQSVEDVTTTNIALIGTAGAGVDDAVFPLNEPIHVFTEDLEKLKKLGTGGTILDAIDGIADQGVRASVTVVRIEEGATVEDTLTNVVGERTRATGVHAFEHAASDLGVVPNIFIAPGFTGQRIDNGANPVVVEMLGIAEKYLGYVLADGPDTNKEDALEWRRDFNNQRLMCLDPHVKVFKNGQTIVQPLAARLAGAGIKRDKQQGGPHHSWSNQAIQGIVNTSRPISYYLTDPDSEANWLNSKGIATIYRETGELSGAQGGYTFWGNESATNDTLWKFMNVRRQFDKMLRELAPAIKPFLGKENIEVHAAVALFGTIEQYLLDEQLQGHILGSDVIFSPDNNSAQEMRLGKFKIGFRAEPSAPMQTIEVETGRYAQAYDVLVEDIVSAVEAIAA